MKVVEGSTHGGTVVDLPAVPHTFLSEATLIDGDWIDRYTVELAEWGVSIKEKGFKVDEPLDNHLLAWYRITDPIDGSEIDAELVTKLWSQTRKHLAGFPGRTKETDERIYLSFTDYCKWRGRRNKVVLMSGMRTGITVARWNEWVVARGGEGAASVAGLKVSRLGCSLDGCRYNVCRNSKEIEEEVDQRPSLLESLHLWKPGRKWEEQFRQQLEYWKELALGFLSEIYTLRKAIDSINKRYFDGRQCMFPPLADGFDKLLTSLEELVDIYNDDLADSIEPAERLLNEAGKGLSNQP